MIPEFPEAREIRLEDKPAFDAQFDANPPELSTYTFTNIFAWRGACETTVSRVGDRILVFRREGDDVTCLEPIGRGAVAPIIEEVLNSSTQVSSFERISGAVAAEVRDSVVVVEPDRDNSDYLYSADDLINLAGRKYDGKRNMIGRAKASIQYEYVKLDARTAMECEEFAEYWCEDRQCETVDGLRRERCAIYQMLSNFEALGIVGGAIRANGAIVAFSLGEALNPETLVIHIEKADSRMEGLYQLINNEFCKAEAAGYRYVNREQDLGIPGLRKAKESYHPLRMIEAFRIRRA